jgi:arylsulfatase A-like enzyme
MDAYVRHLRHAGLALALAGAAACGGGGAPSDRGAAPPPNLLLVVVDTLRADHLGAYGYGRDTSPALDRLAAGAVLFEQARAQAPCTFPSVNSLLTSRPVWEFSGRPAGHLGIPAEVPTLPAHLRRAGYRTAAVSASPVVREAPAAINREGGFGRGFDLFLDGCTWRDGRCVGRRAETLLDLLPEPFFLYLHYLDPHDPYAPPPAARRRFAGAAPADPALAAGDPRPAADRLYATGDAGLAAAEVGHLEALYDEEIAWLDARLADLVAELDRRALLDRTLLVLTADHGESFLAHGHLRHCRSLYDDELRVPLLVRPPGASTPRRIPHPVALHDLAPTLLDYAGLEPSSLLAGRTLRPWIEGDAPPAVRPVPAAAATLRALTVGRWKLIHDLETGSSLLYDLQTDPRETRDLAPTHPEPLTRLLTLLDRHLRQVEGEGLPASPERLDRSKDLQHQLRALGYLQ